MRKQHASFGMVLLAVWLGGSCSDTDNGNQGDSTDTTTSLATIAQSLNTDQHILTVVVPAGVPPTSLALVGNASMSIGTGATVVDADENPAAIASLGSGTLNVGQAASVGTTWGASATVLRAGASVTGDMHVGGTLTMHAGAVVTGDVVEEVFAQTPFEHVVGFPGDAPENVS